MIRFTLRCDHDHRFDSWFRDNRAYEELAAAGQVTCPACGSGKVEKAPMAPHVASPAADAPDGGAVAMRRLLMRLRHEIEASCENVGDRFAEEARRIHYGESPERGIYGEATAEQARELEEEDIAVARVPWLQRRES